MNKAEKSITFSLVSFRFIQFGILFQCTRISIWWNGKSRTKQRKRLLHDDKEASSHERDFLDAKEQNDRAHVEKLNDLLKGCKQ